MANYNFKKDLIIGEDGEKVVLDDLIALGASYDSNNKTNSHDLVITFRGKSVSYECKTDVYDDTGNMFIETHCRGKESGISVTQADWFVTYYKKFNELWYIQTKELKRILESDTHKKINECGDKNSNTEGYLLNKNMYRNNFIVRHSKKHILIIPKWQKELNQNLPSN